MKPVNLRMYTPVNVYVLPSGHPPCSLGPSNTRDDKSESYTSRVPGSKNRMRTPKLVGVFVLRIVWRCVMNPRR